MTTIAQRLWQANIDFSNFEDDLESEIGAFDGLGHDWYDCSLEIYGAHADLRLNLKAQQMIREAGFSKVYVNHGDRKDEYRQETHYDLSGKLPVKGWRRKYVSDKSSPHDRVIAGDPDPGYWEISHWPKGWDDPRTIAQREAGYYRIVPDPLEEAHEADA